MQIRWTQEGFSLVSMLLIWVFVCGWWGTSAPDPRFGTRDRLSAARAVLRVSLLVVAGVSTLAVSVDMWAAVIIGGASSGPLDQSQRVVLDTLEWLSRAGSLAVMLAMVAAYFPILVYARGLSERMADGVLRARAGRLLWLGPVLVALYPIGAGAALWGIGLDSPSTEGYWLHCGVVLLWLGAWLVVWVGMLDRLRRSLEGAAAV